ncbi:hypothetical protein HY385_00460 [Candidatus Daviesbacteria bacterium]|nr:hypothetical protein [Candidatus Daviesbacteria bacterium]
METQPDSLFWTIVEGERKKRREIQAGIDKLNKLSDNNPDNLTPEQLQRIDNLTQQLKTLTSFVHRTPEGSVCIDANYYLERMEDSYWKRLFPHTIASSIETPQPSGAR